jgi:hypothetical protein
VVVIAGRLVVLRLVSEWPSTTVRSFVCNIIVFRYSGVYFFFESDRCSAKNLALECRIPK